MSAAPTQHRAPAVPLMQLDQNDPELLEELLGVVRRVASVGAFTLGAELETFERDFAEWCETPHAIGVSSGTEALTLVMKALGIGPGDEVIVPAYTFIATAEAVALAGGTPKFVDVDPVTQLITADIVAPHIGARTRAVIPVHLFGRTVEMDPLMDLARSAGIAVVEDCAQAHGARYRGRRVGSIGDAGCFSFYPTKNLGGWGDGGGVTTADPELADRVELLRSHGERPRYRHRIVGTTARLDALQAAILGTKLPRLEGWNDRRREIAAQLRDGLRETVVQAPAEPAADDDHVYHLFVVRADDRDDLREHLTAHGVGTAVHYPTPLHLTEAFAYLGVGEGELPVCEDLIRHNLSIPLSPFMDDGQVQHVIQAVQAYAPQEAPGLGS